MSYVEYLENNEKEQPNQETILNNLLFIVKTQGQHMKNSIYNNKLKNSLKYAKEMLNTLRTNDLNLQNYYHLYTSIFDEMQHMLNYFQEELHRGRIIHDFYDIIQQCDNIIPRIFLLICVGVPYIDSGECDNPFDIIYDIFNLMRGVQSPLRGLFCRYFFLQILKDKFSECKNDEISIIKLILENLEYMNFMWIALSRCGADQTYTTSIQREKLKNLIGDNITRLASLNFVTFEIYSTIILPKIIEIALESKDFLSQKYLLQFTIYAFPDEYNISCINLFVDIFPKLDINVDSKEIMISLMEKLTKYISSHSKEDIKFLNKNIFILIKNNVEKIIFDSKNDFDLERLLHLIFVFINFIIKCNPNENDLLGNLNIILNNCVNIINKNKMIKFFNLNIYKLIQNILEILLDLGISIFQLEHYFELFSFLNNYSKKEVSIKIISSLVSNYEKKNIPIDSTEKAIEIIKYIRSLYENNKNDKDDDEINFDKDEGNEDVLNICKILSIIRSEDPEIMFEILKIFKNAFINMEKGNKKYLISSLVNAYLSFCLKLQNNYYNNNEKIDKEMILNIINKIYIQVENLINNLEDIFPEIAFRLYLEVSTKIIHIKNIDKDSKFNEVCYNNIINSIQVLIKKSNKIKENIRIDLINNFIGSILLIFNSQNINVFSTENFLSLAQQLIDECQNISKKNDQCISLLNCSNLFYNALVKDSDKINQLLIKSKKLADFSMTNSRNCILFLKIINKYFFFEEKSKNDNSFNFSYDYSIIEALLELVQNHIQNMKNQKIRPDFLSDIEEYYSNTMLLFDQRKKLGNHW